MTSSHSRCSLILTSILQALCIVVTYSVIIYHREDNLSNLPLRRLSGSITTTNTTLQCIKHKIMQPSRRRQALLLSSSNCHGYSTLEFAKGEIISFLKRNDVDELVFVPYAQNDFDGYTAKIKEAINPWGISVTGLHTYPEPASALNSAKAVFVGGGNTFLLLSRLYSNNLVELIRDKVNLGSLMYIGSSAGTNVATKSIHTTNDMPIIFPPTFDAIGIVPFNINPHYIDKIESETHKGETRDQRINEYLEMSHASDVLGLREGCILHVDGECLTLKGVAGAVLFQKGQNKTEYPVGADVSFLLSTSKLS